MEHKGLNPTESTKLSIVIKNVKNNEIMKSLTNMEYNQPNSYAKKKFWAYRKQSEYNWNDHTVVLEIKSSFKYGLVCA